MERIFTFENHTLHGKQLSYETVKTLQELLRGVVTREKGTGTHSARCRSVSLENPGQRKQGKGRG